MPTPSVSRVIAMMAAALLLLVSCADAQSKSGDGEAVPGVTDDSVTIGDLFAMSGSLTWIGLPISGGERWVYDQANKQGGIHGRKIKVKLEDTQCDPQKAIGAARKLANEVFALSGMACSGAAIGVKDTVLPEAEIPMQSTSAGGYTSRDSSADGFVRDAFFFDATWAQAIPMVNFAVDYLGAKRIALVRQDDDYGEQGAEGVREAIKATDAKLVVDTKVSDAETTDVSSQVLRVKRAQPDATLMFMYQTPAQAFLRQSYEQGLTSASIASGGVVFSPAMFKALGPKALGNFYGQLGIRDFVDSPAMSTMVDSIIDAYPHTPKTNLILSGVGNAEIVVEALRRAGRNLTRDKFVKALESINGDFSLTSTASPPSYSARDHLATGGARFYEVTEDGQTQWVADGYWPATPGDFKRKDLQEPSNTLPGYGG